MKPQTTKSKRLDDLMPPITHSKKSINGPGNDLISSRWESIPGNIPLCDTCIVIAL